MERFNVADRRDQINLILTRCMYVCSVICLYLRM